MSAPSRPERSRLSRNLKVARRSILAAVVVFLVALGALVYWANGRGVDNGELVESLRSADAALPLDLADGATLGSPTAKVTLIVFADFQCPFCLRYTALQEPGIVEEYVATGRVRLEFRNFPRLGEESLLAAEAAECAAEQDRFWPFHNRLFLAQAEAKQASDEKVNVGRFAPEQLRTLSQDAGLDLARYDQCLLDGEARAAVQEDVQEASALGVQGVPAFVIDGKVVVLGLPKSTDVLREVLDTALR